MYSASFYVICCISSHSIYIRRRRDDERGREILGRSWFICRNSRTAAVAIEHSFCWLRFRDSGNSSKMVRDTNMEKLQDMANRLRIESVQSTEASKSGYNDNIKSSLIITDWLRPRKHQTSRILSLIFKHQVELYQSAIFFKIIIQLILNSRL